MAEQFQLGQVGHADHAAGIRLLVDHQRIYGQDQRLGNEREEHALDAQAESDQAEQGGYEKRQQDSQRQCQADVDQRPDPDRHFRKAAVIHEVRKRHVGGGQQRLVGNARCLLELERVADCIGAESEVQTLSKAQEPGVTPHQIDAQGEQCQRHDPAAAR